MQRREIVQICQLEVIDQASRLFNTRRDALEVFPDYEGAANLVYQYKIDGEPFILRLSYSPDRPKQQILAELHFVDYLAQNGVRVSRPVPSIKGRLVETILAGGISFQVVSFIKGEGMRVPDNGYQYRTGAPIEEYFQNWGQVLGQMHALTKGYQPAADQEKRPGWFDLHKNRIALDTLVPEHLQDVRQRIKSKINEIKSHPKDTDSFGLIHGDFNDGNFTVDYTNGDITVFDFDNSCYFWFIYELASAWEGGVGRVMFSGLEERSTFMKHYMEQVLEGYHRWNTLSDEWLARLPLFIQLIQIEEFLHYVQSIDQPDADLQARLAYKIKCIEEDIPYMGFFDRIYSPQKPFSL